jgi:hypothetical protein
MYKKLLLASLVLCLFLFGGAPLALAGQADPEAPTTNLIEKMTSEGWRQVAEGVLQRTRGGDSAVESFAYGPEGFQWLEQELLKQLELMQKEQQAHPSRKLARTIERQKREIVKIQQALRNNEIPTLQEKVIINGCDISYGAHADAYYQTSYQGVGAVADAYFYNNCGYSGHTEAYVSLQATWNGVTSTHSVFDPKDGQNIRSDASWSLQGNANCYSYASGYVSSPGLGISYFVSDSNDQCPPPPPQVTISGPTSSSITGYTCRTLTWTASASGGVPGYSYTWYRDGYYVGSGSSYSETFCGDNFAYTEYVNLSVTATDSAGSQATDTHTTTVRYYRSTTTCDPYDPYKAMICPQEPVY